MPVPVDVRQLRDALRLVRLVASLDPANQFRNVPQAMSSFATDISHSGTFPRVAPSPSWCYLDTSDNVIVALAGILTPEDGLRFFASTLQAMTPVRDWKANAALVAVARTIFATVASTAAMRPRSFVLCGHSYGGSLAQVLAALLSDAGLASAMQVCTFGSPRPGDKSLSARLTPFTVRRYMTSGDPVPRFPPHLDEAPLMVAAVPFGVATTWAQYVQPFGGVQLGALGSVTPQQLPTRIVPLTDVELVAWALSPRGFYAHPHQIGEYQRRIALAISSGQAATDSALTGSGPEPGVPLTPAAYTAAADGEVLAALPPAGEGNPVAAYIPPTFRAVPVRSGTTYHVMWMGAVIFDAPNKSSARSQARWLNQWLRKMQTAQAIHGNDLQTTLGAYLLACVNPTLGFNPAANVV